MTVKIVLNPNQSIEEAPKHYFGISSDTKPTIAIPGDLPAPTVGSDFIETDTQRKYITGDGTIWFRETTEKALGDLKTSIDALKDNLDEIAFETGKIRTGHERNLWGEIIEEVYNPTN